MRNTEKIVIASKDLVRKDKHCNSIKNNGSLISAPLPSTTGSAPGIHRTPSLRAVSPVPLHLVTRAVHLRAAPWPGVTINCGAAGQGHPGHHGGEYAHSTWVMDGSVNFVPGILLQRTWDCSSNRDTGRRSGWWWWCEWSRASGRVRYLLLDPGEEDSDSSHNWGCTLLATLNTPGHNAYRIIVGSIFKHQYSSYRKNHWLNFEFLFIQFFLFFSHFFRG